MTALHIAPEGERVCLTSLMKAGRTCGWIDGCRWMGGVEMNREVERWMNG